MATAQQVIWFQNSKEQLDAVLLDVCEELQLAPTRYQLAVERYRAVNRLLERQGSPFQFFRPRIFPQGSMALGTTSKPVEGPSLDQFPAVRRTRKDADPVGDCVVFDIKNNEARLISYISYEMGTVTVLAVLTHKEYDKGGWKNACNC